MLVQPQKRKRRIVRKPLFWWALGGSFFLSGAIIGIAIESLYPSVLFLAGKVIQAYECVRVVYTAGAASWLASIVLEVVKLAREENRSPDENRPIAELPRSSNRAAKVLGALAFVAASVLVVGFACLVGLITLLSSSAFQVLSPSSPNGCRVVYGVSFDFRDRADGRFYVAPDGSYMASPVNGGYIRLGYHSEDIGSDPIQTGQWSLTWQESQGTLLIQDTDPITIDCPVS